MSGGCGIDPYNNATGDACSLMVSLPDGSGFGSAYDGTSSDLDSTEKEVLISLVELVSGVRDRSSRWRCYYDETYDYYYKYSYDNNLLRLEEFIAYAGCDGWFCKSNDRVDKTVGEVQLLSKPGILIVLAERKRTW